MGGEQRTAKAVEGMNAAKGYFKKCIASAIRMRKIPELIFQADNSLEYSAHIEEILANLPKPVSENEEAVSSDEEEGNED